ncbi:hypothetical protein M407DRAFT_25442 [Tulasnella calospora MUT 4182]|uniref:Mitochondrial import inner membrane translocase subunit n=1 Tax=Tulasnella calospora MUT 4182 TaxID=1051891 RepID=A0A0C3QHI1_9AGAM|nr:hypothetical protein M407DRAFT_25442 [Tulasnella calospora MUT 4182]
MPPRCKDLVISLSRNRLGQGCIPLCWTKCMPGSVSTVFSRGAEPCLLNCVDRFLDTNLFIVNKLEAQWKESAWACNIQPDDDELEDDQDEDYADGTFLRHRKSPSRSTISPFLFQFPHTPAHLVYVLQSSIILFQ